MKWVGGAWAFLAQRRDFYFFYFIIIFFPFRWEEDKKEKQEQCLAKPHEIIAALLKTKH